MRSADRSVRPLRWLLLVGAIIVLAVGLAWGALSSASTNVVYLPAILRSSSQPAASFAIALPGDGVLLTRSGVTLTNAIQMAAGPVLPDSVNLQAASLTFDDALDLQLTVRGDLTVTSSSGTFSDTILFDWIGRPPEVQRTPFISFVQSCQQSPTSDPKTYVARGSGFPPNSQVWLRSRQIGGDEQFPFARPYAVSATGDWSASFLFWSDMTKWWWLEAFLIAGGQTPLASAEFKTLVGEDCPPPSVVEPPAVPLADAAIPFASNSTFDVRFERTNGIWSAVIYRWDGQRWSRGGAPSFLNVEGSTLRARVLPRDLGLSGKCVTWGVLSQRFAPGASQGVGKAALIDQARGPLATLCWNPDETGAVGGPVVEAWTGCGGSHAGLLGPPCEASVQSQAQGSGVGPGAAAQSPAILGQVVGGAAIPLRTCTSERDCPAVGMEIWIHPDGLASFEPYGQYGPFRFRLSTAPPTPNQPLTVSIQQADYGRVRALSLINDHIGTTEYQNLLAEYRAALTPLPGATFDAAGTTLYPPGGSYSTYFAKLDQRLRWQPIVTWTPSVERMIWFSQVPLTFREPNGETKFIISVGSGYLATGQ